jgi:hypothetical protein
MNPFEIIRKVFKNLKKAISCHNLIDALEALDWFLIDLKRTTGSRQTKLDKNIVLIDKLQREIRDVDMEMFDMDVEMDRLVDVYLKTKNTTLMNSIYDM